MSTATRDRSGMSLADLTSGKTGRPRAPLDDVLPNVRHVLDRVGDVAEAEAAGRLIRGVMGGGEGGGGGGIKDVAAAMRDIHEIVTSSEDRAQQLRDKAEADKVQATNRQQALAIQREGIAVERDKSTGELLLGAITALSAQGKGGGIDLQAIAAIIAAITPLLTLLLDRKAPDDSPMREYMRELRDDLKQLREKVNEGTAKGGDLASTLELLTKMQSLGVGGMMSPADRLALRRVDVEEKLGLHGMNLQYGAQRGDAEQNTAMLQLAAAAVTGGAVKVGGGGGGQAPEGAQQPAAAGEASRRYQLRCGHCGHTWYGMPTDTTTCPKCQTPLARKAS